MHSNSIGGISSSCVLTSLKVAQQHPEACTQMPDSDTVSFPSDLDDEFEIPGTPEYS